jgi:probable F420-dependent oxidoreductase
MTDLRSRVGRYGVFLGRLSLEPAAALRRDAAKIEAMGYRTVWVGEAFGREPLTLAAILLAATERLVVATGIASIWARDAVATMNAARTLSEAWPGRFVLGVGVSHPPLVNARGHDYRRPHAAMASYLTAMRASRYDGPPPEDDPAVLIAALGPRMLELAASQADGVFTYFVSERHTHQARAALGPLPVLAVEQAVVLAESREGARRDADAYVSAYLALDNYRSNLRRLGYSEADVRGAGSDPLFDSLIGWGDGDALTTMVHRHLEAGADHVAVQVVTPASPHGVMDGLSRLAELMKPGEPPG